MGEYAGFLRGINVGGHNKIEMAALRQALSDAGLRKVKTLLASGNVLFESDSNEAENVQKQIEGILQQTFGQAIHVVLRSREQIAALVESDPFHGVEVTPQTRLYITFLPAAPKSLPAKEEIATAEDFQVLGVTPTEVVTVLNLGAGGGTADSMLVLEKVFGKQVTTRNWNTIQKVHSGWG